MPLAWRRVLLFVWTVTFLELANLSIPAKAQSSSTNQWTWMGGSSTVGCFVLAGVSYCAVPGQYGVQGSAMPSNTPGSRVAAATWTDQNGHFWLFGGNGFDS